MAETFSVHLGNGSDHSTISIGAYDYIGFGGSSDPVAPISQDTFQDNTCKTDATMSASTGTGQNVKYVSTTEVSLNGAPAVTLNTTNVTQLAMTSRWHYDDTPTATALSSIRFFAYKTGQPVATAPDNVVITAFERTSSAINKDTVAGTGYGWNAAYGIGGIGNALMLSDQSSSVDHDIYIALSAKPTARGLNSSITLRLEFDVT